MVALLSAIATSLTSSSGSAHLATAELMVKLLVDGQVGGSARNALLQVITSTLPQVSIQIASCMSHYIEICHFRVT